MEIPVIDLTLFEAKYRQAILFTMIEALIEGRAFSFSDDRDANEIENELVTSNLAGYRWARRAGKDSENVAYLIERYSNKQNEGCCSYCGAQSTDHN